MWAATVEKAMFLLGRLSHRLKGDMPQCDHKGEGGEGKGITSQSVVESSEGSEVQKCWAFSLFKGE